MTAKKRVRQKNASPSDAESMKQMRAHLAKVDSEILFAEGAYGRMPKVKDWEGGKDFRALPEDGKPWIGGQYFSIRDVETIYAWGYKKIVFGGAEGFDVDLVMQ